MKWFQTLHGYSNQVRMENIDKWKSGQVLNIVSEILYHTDVVVAICSITLSHKYELHYEVLYDPKHDHGF